MIKLTTVRCTACCPVRAGKLDVKCGKGSQSRLLESGSARDRRKTAAAPRRE
jgi:hypothetical protein